MIKHDLILKAAFSGTIAAILANISLYLINLLIPGRTINMPQLSAEFFLDIENYTVLHHIMGFVWSIVVGGTYALIYVFIVDNTGWNNLWIKSIFTISVIWLLAGGFAMRVMEIGQYMRDEPLSVLAFYLAHLLFATYLSIIISKLRGQA